MVRCGLVLLVMAGAACGGSTAKPDGGPGGTGGGGAGGSDPNRWTGTVSDSINRNVDILFLIDDSSSMRLLQDNLIRNFPTFITRLQDPPGLPNVHIAVVSQDMGAGDGSISSCSTIGKGGIFQYTARGTCTATNLQAGATYIADIGGIRNYTGNLADVFTCIAALGETGCGFEHQFAALLRALGADGSPPPVENQDFLRPDAYLAIIMLTNEDDCSEVQGSQFFDTNVNTNLASQLGPPINFRCNEFGHLCDDASANKVRPGRLAPNADLNSMVTYSNCTSNETGQNLRTVADTANRIKALKADPGMIAVASIQGPPTPYTVTWKAPNTADTSCSAASCPWPAIAHSCTATDGSFADPGIRTAEFAGAFGANGLVLPICTNDYAPSLDRAAQMINGLLGPPCIPGLIGLNPATGEPDCKITERTRSATGMTATKTVPACAENGNVAPCWQLQSSATCVGSVLSVSVDPSLPASTEATITYDCAKDTTF